MSLYDEANCAVWSAALESLEPNSGFKKQLIDKLSEVYKTPLRESFETVAGYFWATLGSILYSGRIKKAFEYKQSAERFLDERHSKRILDRIEKGAGQPV